MADELGQRENGQSKFDDSEMKWGDGEKENWEQYEVSGTVVGENCFGRTDVERTGVGRTGIGRTGIGGDDLRGNSWENRELHQNQELRKTPHGIEQNSGRHLHILYMLIAIFVTAAAGLSCMLLGVKSYKAVTGFVFFGMLAICAFLIQRSKEEFHEKESVQAYAATITVGEDYEIPYYGLEQHKVAPHGTEQHGKAQYGQEQHKVAPHGTVQQLTPYLAGSDKEPIFISEGVLKIGRVMSQVDYCLNVPGISRVHAQIEKSDSQVMLMDVGSTNGTYVNGRRLPANQKEEIRHGDVVSFAGEEYYCL
jgi:hypothetical protein